MGLSYGQLPVLCGKSVSTQQKLRVTQTWQPQFGLQDIIRDGPHSYPTLDDFATVSEDELARWSKTQVLRACFAFDLVAEGAEGDEEKLRDRLLQLLRCHKGAFPGTVPEE